MANCGADEVGKLMMVQLGESSPRRRHDDGLKIANWFLGHHTTIMLDNTGRDDLLPAIDGIDGMVLVMTCSMNVPIVGHVERL